MVTTTRKKDSKRERVSFSGSRRRLNGTELVPEIADQFHVRWFNDQNDRIERALNAGWEFVSKAELDGRVGDKEVHGDNSDLNDKVSKVVGQIDNVPLRAYFMKIRNEFWEEDQAEKEALNMRVDEAIRGGTSGGASVANRYGKVDLSRR